MSNVDADQRDNYPDEVVESIWPYDGPHSPESVRSALAAAAELVRYANNATWQPYTLPYAPSVNRDMGKVGSIVYGLDQLLDQLGGALKRHAGDPTLYDDRRDRTGKDTALAAVQEITSLRQTLFTLCKQVDKVQSLTNHLGHDSTDDED